MKRIRILGVNSDFQQKNQKNATTTNENVKNQIFMMTNEMCAAALTSVNKVWLEIKIIHEWV